MDQEISNSERYLRELPIQGGFSVPQNYFSELENKLMPEEEASLFPPVQGGFVVPENYFVQLNLQLEERLSKRLASSISLYGKPVFMWVGIAASLLFVFGLFLYQPRPEKELGSNQKISAEDIAAHLNDVDLSEDLLCDAGWCSEIDKLNIISDSAGMNALNLEIDEDYIIDEL